MKTRERHRLYKKALEILKETGPEYGLCFCISNASERRLTYLEVQLLPEVMMMKPKESLDKSYWWQLDLNGHKERKKVLLKCIRKTKPKPHVRAKKRA